jgi:hypothetical protein
MNEIVVDEQARYGKHSENDGHVWKVFVRDIVGIGRKSVPSGRVHVGVPA